MNVMEVTTMRRVMGTVVAAGMLFFGLISAPPAANASATHCGTTNPCPRNAMGIAFDREHEQIVLFGGTDNSGVTLGDTWIYDVTTGVWTWQDVSGPCTRHSHRMAYDETNQRVVLFGGTGGPDCTGTPGNETWLWNGDAPTPGWTQPSGTNPPSSRSSFALAWDGANGYVLLFGGNGCGNVCGDTWSWDGTSWTQRCTSCTQPSARKNASMIYSIARGKVIQYGGQDSSGVLQGDTIQWTGTQWQKLNNINSPSGRTFHRMAYDENAGLIMLFGGCTANCDNFGSSTLTDDQGSLGTGSWSLVNPTPRPSARCCMGLVYADTSPFTGNSPGIFLVGGADNTHTGLNFMYFYDGSSWCKVTGATTCGPF
jgi:hypothetical protein